jgi:hypothetical protein
LTHSDSEKRSLPTLFILLLSAISGVAASIVMYLVGNTFFAVAYGLLIFLFNLTLLSLILNKQIDRTFSFRAFAHGVYLYVVLGFIASVCILLIPNATIQLNVNSLLSTFASLAPLSYLRVISAFFLTGLFPGLIVYFVFMQKYDFNLVERIGIVLLISYCFTMISGLLLGLIEAFSTISYVLSFWLFSGILLGYRQIKHGKKPDVPVNSSLFSIDINLLALILVASALIVLSYIQVLASAPMSGIVGGDVLDYMVAATRFSWSDFAGWSPYVWSNNFYLLISNLAGLPMHLVYVGLQFYLIIPIAGFYFFARTIFPGYKKIAAIATMLCFFVAGVTSWFLFSQTTNLLAAYQNPDLVNKIFSYASFPGITPLALSPWIFDFGFLFFALAFVYRAVFKKERKLVNYFLPAIFAAADFFSHSLNILFVFIFSIAIFFVFFAGCRKYLLKLSLLTLAFVLALDPLSKWMLVDNIYAAVAAVGILNFGSIFPSVVGAIAIVFGGLFTVLYIKKRRLSFQTKRSFDIIGKITLVLSNSKTKLLFYIGAFTFFGISVFIYLNIDPNAIDPNANPSIAWIICRSFGIIFPFALASIPFMIRQKRSSLLFTSVMSLAIFASTVITVSLPAIIPPYIGYVRYVSYLVIPLSILAAFGIFNSLEHLKKRHFRRLFVVLLVVLVSTSILSQAYVRERLFDLGQSQTKVTLVYNLPGISGGLLLTGDAIAQIFEGYITTWNDTRIAIINPSANLPNQTIIKFYRSDSSNTTYVFTRYLADQRPDLKIIVGSDPPSKWLSDGQGKRGNSGVASAVSSTQYAIGYVELAYALANNLNVVSVQNLWFREDTVALIIPDNPLTADSVEAIDWINVNLPKGTTILPLSLTSEKILSNFVLDVKVTPYFQAWRLMDVLNSSSPEILMNCLNTLGINYVFADAKDSFSDSFRSTIQSLPMVYSNNETTIYNTRTSVFNDSTVMPYLDSLFKKITFSLYEQYTGSTPMNNKVIWFSNISATGDMQVSSNNISINETNFSVHSMQVTTSNSSVSYEGKMLSDFSVKGAGDIFASSMKSANLSAAMGPNTIVDLIGSQDVSILLRDAEINFKLGSTYESFNNANISIILETPTSLVSICRQPLVAVNGNLTGNALGLVHGETFDYETDTTLTRENVNLPLTIELPLADNLLYSQVTNAKVDKSSTQ